MLTISSGSPVEPEPLAFATLRLVRLFLKNCNNISLVANPSIFLDSAVGKAVWVLGDE